MTIQLNRVIKLLSIAFIGGLISFFINFFILSFLVPMPVDIGTIVSVSITAVVLLGALITLFIKKLFKFPLFVFCLGFIFINKFFEGMFVLIDSSLL